MNKHNETFFGINLRVLRNRKGLSQGALADDLDIERPRLASYEEGRAEPPLSLLLKICYYFEISSDDLLTIDLYIRK